MKLRKIKGYKVWLSHELLNVPKGVCNLCGGKGKYRETFKHKNPIIHTCGKCRGTGNVKIRVSYIGETDRKTGLWKWGIYDLISESESNYVIQNKKNELMQMPKVMFKLNI